MHVSDVEPLVQNTERLSGETEWVQPLRCSGRSDAIGYHLTDPARGISAVPHALRHEHAELPDTCCQGLECIDALTERGAWVYWLMRLGLGEVKALRLSIQIPLKQLKLTAQLGTEWQRSAIPALHRWQVLALGHQVATDHLIEAAGPVPVLERSLLPVLLTRPIVAGPGPVHVRFALLGSAVHALVALRVHLLEPVQRLTEHHLVAVVLCATPLELAVVDQDTILASG